MNKIVEVTVTGLEFLSINCMSFLEAVDDIAVEHYLMR